MNIKQVLQENDFGHLVSRVPLKIKEFDVGKCTHAKEIPNDKFKLFDGIILSDDNNTKEITINLEDNEFSPMEVAYIGADGYIMVYVTYDEECEVIEVNDVT